MACEAAYRHGDEWLEGVLAYIKANAEFTRAYLQEHLPRVKMTKLEGTYLVWVDCSVLKKPSEEIVTALLEKEKVWVNEGSMYGEDGDNFIRINIACPRQQLAKGLERLKYAFGQLS